ncbi:MAG: PTS-dependent dihydroxyacetone kinase phosphotransferase subunit DhaM [Ruaniaceae bacterium]|nr:PTS-dependent dihydroxyacetone kinase phosphotransferase subunit DhaM [Ruaniaceae bacterium]
MSVALLIVSHSEKLAEGVVEVAAQMAPSVAIRAAGGTDDGRIGTSFDKIAVEIAALRAGGHDVVVLTDLGSATMTASAAIEFTEGDCVRLADAPLVEGAVAASVAAAQGKGLPDVLAAAEAAGHPIPGARDNGGAIERDVAFANEMGLHARPAAVIATRASEYDCEVTINGVDASSVLSLLALNAPMGARVTVRAVGPDAQQAVDEIVALIERGFDGP